MPPPASVSSRWQKGPTSFGAFGRLAITMGVAVVGVGATAALMQGGWPFALWFLTGYGLLAGVILHQVWRPERVPTERLASGSAVARLRARLARRSPRLARDVSPRAVLLALLAIAAGAGAVAWGHGSDVPRYLLVTALACVGMGICLAHFNDL